MIKKVIFEMDETLLPKTSFDIDQRVVKQCVEKDEVKTFLRMYPLLLQSYAKSYQKYDIRSLCAYFLKLGYFLKEEDLKKIITSANSKEVASEIAYQLLSELQDQNKDLVLLTRGFREVQQKRLEQTKLLLYFKKVIYGDDILKPNIEAYQMAAEETPFENCLMVGNLVYEDYRLPKGLGMQAFYTEGLSVKEKIKKLRKEIC